MSAALPTPDPPDVPVTSVAGAIARMEAIGAALPAGDGLACFNRMYLDVTSQVNSQLGQGFYADPAFMTQLDVTFANLYFAAADMAGNRRLCRWPGGRWWSGAPRWGSNRSSSRWRA